MHLCQSRITWNTVSGIFKEQLRLKRTMNFVIVFWDLNLWTSEASFILEILKENVNDFQAVFLWMLVFVVQLEQTYQLMWNKFRLKCVCWLTNLRNYPFNIWVCLVALFFIPCIYQAFTLRHHIFKIQAWTGKRSFKWSTGGAHRPTCKDSNAR